MDRDEVMDLFVDLLRDICDRTRAQALIKQPSVCRWSRFLLQLVYNHQRNQTLIHKHLKVPRPHKY